MHEEAKVYIGKKGVVFMPKVFCIDCKHYGWILYATKSCTLIKETIDTPVEKKTVYHECEVQNKDNDCELFK